MHCRGAGCAALGSLTVDERRRAALSGLIANESPESTGLRTTTMCLSGAVGKANSGARLCQALRIIFSSAIRGGALDAGGAAALG